MLTFQKFEGEGLRPRGVVATQRMEKRNYSLRSKTNARHQIAAPRLNEYQKCFTRKSYKAITNFTSAAWLLATDYLPEYGIRNTANEWKRSWAVGRLTHPSQEEES